MLFYHNTSYNGIDFLSSFVIRRPVVVSSLRALFREKRKMTTRVTPEQFNNLHLPVRWSGDFNGNGQVDEAELWVHPELVEINEYLKKRAEDPINPQAFVDAGMSYLRTPEKKKVRHPLLTEDLNTRIRIRSSFDLNSIKEGPYRDAARELVRAASLGYIYYNLQSDLDFIPHLRSVLATGDYIKIRHFWQSGGAMCVADKNPECTSLPEIQLDPNGIWWPDSWTKEDIDFLKSQYTWSNELQKKKVFTPGSMLIECDVRDQDAFEYPVSSGKFYRPVSLNKSSKIKDASKLIATHIRNAANSLAGVEPAYSQMLRMTAEAIEGEEIFDSPELYKSWIKSESKLFVTIFGSYESSSLFADPYAIKAVFESMLAIVDTSLNDLIEGARSAVGNLDEEIRGLWEDKGEIFPIRKVDAKPPVANVVRNIINSGSLNSAYVSGGFRLPNWNKQEIDVPAGERTYKTVYFGDIMAARIEGQGLAVAKAAFDDELVGELGQVVSDIPAIVYFTQSHEFGHAHVVNKTEVMSLCSEGDGSYFGAEFSDCLKSSLIDLYGEPATVALEEAKADTLGIFSIARHEVAGLITPEMAENAYRAHAGNLLRDFNLAEGELHRAGAVASFYYYVKHGVITYNSKTNRYHFDLKKLREKIDVITKELLSDYLSLDLIRVKKVKERAELLFNKGVLIVDGHGKEVRRRIGRPMKGFLDGLKIEQENLMYYEPMGV